MINAGVLIVFQKVVNGVFGKRLSVVKNSFFRECLNDLFDIYSFCIFFKDVPYNIGFVFFDDEFSVYQTVTVLNNTSREVPFESRFMPSPSDLCASSAE